MPKRDDPASYGQFCPVAMAAEILCTRWTALIVREMLCGSTRFNDIRRGLPLISPTLLSKRLKELEAAGVIDIVPVGEAGPSDYRLTTAGEDLRPVILGLGFWAQRWIESSLSLKNIDPALLMWDIRRNLNPKPLPTRRCVINFTYPEVEPGKQAWWLVVDGDGVDLCQFDPGFDVDLFVRCPLRSMTAVWMGMTTVERELEARRLDVVGDPSVARSMRDWLGLSVFAHEKSMRPSSEFDSPRL